MMFFVSVFLKCGAMKVILANIINQPGGRLHPVITSRSYSCIKYLL
jgi:hypothetical protein